MLLVSISLILATVLFPDRGRRAATSGSSARQRAWEFIGLAFIRNRRLLPYRPFGPVAVAAIAATHPSSSPRSEIVRVIRERLVHPTGAELARYPAAPTPTAACGALPRTT